VAKAKPSSKSWCLLQAAVQSPKANRMSTCMPCRGCCLMNPAQDLNQRILDHLGRLASQGPPRRHPKAPRRHPGDTQEDRAWEPWKLLIHAAIYSKSDEWTKMPMIYTANMMHWIMFIDFCWGKMPRPLIWCESEEGDPHRVLATKVGSAAPSTDHHRYQGNFSNTVRTPFR